MINAVSVATVLSKQGDKQETGIKPSNSNRFMLLRDRSRSVSASGRLPSPSQSTKRRAEEEAAKAGKSARIDRNTTFLSMETVEKNISQGRKTVEKLKSSLASDESCNSFLKEFLGGVVDSLDAMANSVEALASVIVDNRQGPTHLTGKGQRLSVTSQGYPCGAHPR